jgi:hypothetical protein
MGAIAAIVFLAILCLTLGNSPGHQLTLRLQNRASLLPPSPPLARAATIIEALSSTKSPPPPPPIAASVMLEPRTVVSQTLPLHPPKSATGVPGIGLLQRPLSTTATTTTTSTELLIIGLVKDSERDLPKRFVELTAIACLPNVSASVAFLEGNSKDDSRKLLNAFAAGTLTRLCPGTSGKHGQVAFRSITVLTEQNTPEFQKLQSTPGNTHEDDRIQRIAALRDQLRDITRSTAATLGTTAVLVIDTDLKELPAAVYVERALRRLRRPRAPGLQCANGQQGHKHRATYYDLFATVLADGTMPMQRIVHPNTSRSDGDKMKVELTKTIKDTVVGQLFPVQSCFGGLAVYPAALYFAKECKYTGGARGEKYSIMSYTKQRPKQPHQGFACEHVHFHQCLRRQLKGETWGAFGIDPMLVTRWQYRKT